MCGNRKPVHAEWTYIILKGKAQLLHFCENTVYAIITV